MEDRRSGMGVMFAALFGALVGAATVLFAKRENREKFNTVYSDIRSRGTRALREARRRAEEQKEEMEKAAKK
jgi:hypothetical protein